MWIAKPVAALSESEKSRWRAILTARLAREEDVPIAQTLAWSAAIEAVSGRASAVFSLEEPVGGIVHAGGANAGHFECVNGPLLDWDESSAAARQLATFATAVARLAPSFSGMTLRPRWDADKAEARSKGLPIAAAASTRAATMIVPLAATDDAQLEGFSQRLRRTLSGTLGRPDAATSWSEATGEHLERFVEGLSEFGDRREFFVPPLEWFRALVAGDELTFRLASASCSGAAASHLVCVFGGRAHYLFGYQYRPEDVPSAVSPAAAAHFRAMRELAALGVREYDLNGYVVDAPEDHPYAGVCRFKDQFGGRIISYQVPEFRIS